MADIIAIWIASPGVVGFWSAISFLLGAYVNHRFASGRDRAKEYNAIVDTVKNQLRRERGDVRYGLVKVDSDSLNTLVDMSSMLRRRRLSVAIAEYKQARQQHTQADRLGQQSYSRTDHVEAAIDRLIKLLKRYK